MTNEENLVLLRKYRSENCITSRNILIESNLGLVQTVLEGMGLARYYEECLSSVFFEMVKCLDNFNENYKTKLSTLLWHYIKTGIFLYFRDNARKEIRYLYSSDENNPIDFLVQEEEKEKILEAIKKLTPYEQEVVTRFFGIGCPKNTFKTMSKEYDTTIGRVQGAKNKAIKKLQEIL